MMSYYCITLINRSSADGASADANFQDQIELLRVMRDVNMDHYVVGWYTQVIYIQNRYQSAPLNTFFTEDAVEAQFGFQESMPNSVVLVYDHVCTQHGMMTCVGEGDAGDTVNESISVV